MTANREIRRRLTAVVAVGALALVATVTPATAQEAFEADVSCRWGARDCSRPARDLVAQFNRLRDHGDLIGFGMGRAPDVSNANHWQGVQRLATQRGRYLAVSRNGANVSFVIVRMASRDRSGERYRSNHIGPTSADTPPPATDRVVTVVAYDRLDAGFNHSGGMQSVGDFLAVGLEDDERSRVVFWTVSDVRHPSRVGALRHETGVDGAGTISLAKLRGGRHLLIVGGTDANTLDFYLSRAGTGLANPRFDHTATWTEDELVGGDSEFGNYQNLNLVASSDGRLYLIGTHFSGIFGGRRDVADLFVLERNPRSPRIRKLASRHLYCAVPGGNQHCDLDAAGGVYVTPTGGLLLYGTERNNDGQNGSVKAEEFRPAPHRPSCENISDSWVELYDDTGFDGDRGVMIDYHDRRLRNYENYDLVEGFEDKASAARWCLPSGRRYRLYQHKRPCRGRTIDLIGTDTPASDREFGDGSGVVRRFNDAVSCSRWIR